MRVRPHSCHRPLHWHPLNRRCTSTRHGRADRTLHPVRPLLVQHEHYTLHLQQIIPPDLRDQLREEVAGSEPDDVEPGGGEAEAGSLGDGLFSGEV